MEKPRESRPKAPLTPPAKIAGQVAAKPLAGRGNEPLLKRPPMSEPAVPRQAAKLRDPTAGVEIAPGVRVLPDVLAFSFARSSGPGGQNVNKVSTKAVLRIRLLDLPLPIDAISRLRATAGYRLVGQAPEDELLLSAEKNRSQEANKEQTLDDLRQMLVAAMKRPKARRVTKPSRGAKLRRLDGKKRRSETKQQRRSVD